MLYHNHKFYLFLQRERKATKNKKAHQLSDPSPDSGSKLMLSLDLDTDSKETEWTNKHKEPMLRFNNMWELSPPEILLWFEM